MTIGVFARAANVTTSALRFYDDCGLVRPASVDAATGYRYYSLEQLDEVVLIRHLRDAGLPLGDVRRLLAGPVEAAEELLAARLRTMEQAVEAARAAAAAALLAIRDRERAVVSLPGRVLAEAIGQVVAAADVTGDIPVLGGVLIEAAAAELTLVATDRYRLAVRSMYAEVRCHVPAAAVVAAATLDDARRWIGAQDSVELRFGDAHVRLAGPGGERRLSTIEEPYPSYRVVLEELPEPLTRVVAPRGLLLSAIGDDPEARLDLAVDGGLTIRSSAGHEPAAVPADVAGEPVAISFMFSTLHPALTAGVGPDVMLRISRPDLPVVVRSADDGDLTTLVMPAKAATPHGHRGAS
ncbi:MerR family transcriptional regulator [Dactylosporangium fulvum]|uniref:MerR family transcriptional regulator n=1 Tax=Dactylosporangium fulvum TaxID=53359 RepID=A0ABY5WDC9_9ACTN|nr:MerR family transcriptional regulator [Dactylosporangium fulvum]UWP87510.1 MerR family transcriptional regulator [Dactylosporangium fulvum]